MAPADACMLIHQYIEAAPARTMTGEKAKLAMLANWLVQLPPEARPAAWHAFAGGKRLREVSIDTMLSRAQSERKARLGDRWAGHASDQKRQVAVERGRRAAATRKGKRPA